MPEPRRSNGGVPCTSRLRRQNIPQLVPLMIGRMIRACGADDVSPLGSLFKKRRFLMNNHGGPGGVAPKGAAITRDEKNARRSQAIRAARRI